MSNEHETNLWTLLEERVRANPDGIAALDEDGRTLTWAESKREAERAAAGFQALGIGAGDVVSWQLPTWLEAKVLVLALARLGAIQNPMLPIYREREVGFVVRQAQSKVLVVPQEWAGFNFEAMATDIAGAVKAEGGSLRVVVADKVLPQGDPSTLPPPPDPSTDPVRWYFYTSGTTADPKGAQHTDRTILASALGMNERMEVTAADRNAVVFPFTHIGGIGWLFSALAVGFPTVYIERFDPAKTIALIQQHEVTMAGAGTPFHMAYLAAQRALPAGEHLFPSVRVYCGGGAPKPPQLHHDVKAEMGGVGIVSGYGLTEAPIITMGSIRDSDDQLAHTEGRAAGTTRLRLVRLDGPDAGVGEEGEIRAKAPQMMRGYLDATLDAEAFDEDGWFKTGDLGKLDADGMLTITGRVKDVIIRNMENVSAKEVEDILFGHPEVADVAVIGIPDPKTGERVCAVVVPSDPAAPLSLADMVAFARQAGLMTQKLPERLEIVDALPRNPTGKVLKFELRTRFGSS
ncbi:MAG: cyclohexanecarboxylate-CoA ligase [Acidimicrobiia bacterium]|nr:cyclohexanecarboxylate-CoA ligase [Acidimicrobiia bacterium]